MAAVQIRVDQPGSGAPPGVTGQAREDLATGFPVTLTAVGGPYLGYQWSIVDKPLDIVAATQSGALLGSPTASTTSFGPIDTVGTYLVQIVVDSGSGLGATPDDIAQITFYAGVGLNSLNPDPEQLPRRQMAFRETTQHNVPDVVFPLGNPRGWAQEWERWFALLRRIDTELAVSGDMSRTWFVDYSGLGTGIGTLDNPFPTIQQAIDAVPALGSVNEAWQILIAPGTYAENLAIPADRNIVLQPLGGLVDRGTSPLVYVVGDLAWTPSGATVSGYVALRGIRIGNITIDQSVASAVPRILDVEGGFASSVSVSAGSYDGIVRTRRSIIGNMIVPAALLYQFQTSEIGNVAVGTIFDSESEYLGSTITINANTPDLFGGTFLGSRFLNASFVNTNSLLYLDGTALRNAAKSGALASPSAYTGGVGWSGDASHYEMQRTVRLLTGNATLGLADDYVACDPPGATTITVTLPDARLFVQAATETNGGVARRPARTLSIRNVGHNAGGIVALATTGGQGIDSGGAASGQILLAGESLVLVPVFDSVLGDYSWEPLSRFGRNYLEAESLAISASTSGTFAAKVSLTTPPLRGRYRVQWSADVSASNAGTIPTARLYNVTDAVQYGVNVIDVVTAVEIVAVGGVSLITFAGAAKQLEIQWARSAGAGDAQIRNAVLELWKV